MNNNCSLFFAILTIFTMKSSPPWQKEINSKKRKQKVAAAPAAHALARTNSKLHIVKKRKRKTRKGTPDFQWGNNNL